MDTFLIWAPAVKRLITTESRRHVANTAEKHIEEEEEEEEDLFAKWITYKLNQINAKGGLPEEQTLINAGRPYNLTIM